MEWDGGGGGVGVEVSASHGMADLVSYGNADRDIEQVYLLFDLYLAANLLLLFQGVIFREIYVFIHLLVIKVEVFVNPSKERAYTCVTFQELVKVRTFVLKLGEMHHLFGSN